MDPKAKPGLVLISLDHHVGQVRFRNGEKEPEVVGIDLYPEILKTLHELDKRDVQSVLIAPVGKNTVLQWRLGGKKPVLVVDWHRDFDEVLKVIQKLLSASVEDALFVSADRNQRGQAQARGLRPGPHLTWALWASEGKEALLVEIEGPRDDLESLGTCLPYRFEIGNENRAVMLGLMNRQGLADAITRRLNVQVLPFDPALEDVLLARLDKVQKHQKVLSQVRVLKANGQMALLALGPNELEDDLNLHGAHGHYELLGPSPVLHPLRRITSDAKLAALLNRWPINELVAERFNINHQRLDLPLWSCPTNAAAIEADVRRYTGSVVPGGGPIRSRHTRHPDNTRAVNLLVADLNAMGYCAQKFAFDYGGRTLHNVIADLPGHGTIRIKPNLREKLRDIFVRFPPWPPEPDPPWRKEVEAMFLRDTLDASWSQLEPEMLRLRLERTFDLRASFPWWLSCPLGGVGAELVLVGCHLDSTSGLDPGYDPTTDTAPGVDDDASGIAVTLALARDLIGRAREFRHTVRFCFFNAEEQGLIGSKAYAAHLKAYDAPVRAVICTDMIGFNSDVNRIFEVHAGYTDAAVRDLSVPIAERIADWAATLGIPGPAQIYKGTASGGGADRNLVDGAINRSDHAAFHQQGYPAVVVSEDFFVNLGAEPGADPNPNYHRAADTVMDYDYASNIACVIAQAVKELVQ